MNRTSANKLTAVAVAVAAAFNGGCGAPERRGVLQAPDIQHLTERAVTVTGKSPTVVEISDEPYVETEALPTVPWKKYGDVVINVQRVNFYDLLHAVGKEYKIGVSLSPDVEVSRGVTLQIEYLSPVAAMKKIAEAAGYVAVYDPGHNHITVAARAVFSFKMPKSIFERLDASGGLSANFLGDAGATQAAGSSPAAAGGGIAEKIQSIAGQNSQVNVFESTGLITVESNVLGLTSVHNFLNHYLAISTAGLDIRAAIIAVDINDERDYGVNWETLLGQNRLFEVTGDGGSSVSGGFSFNVARQNLGVILSSLQKQRSIEILAQPQMSSANLQTAALLSGDQVPYLSRIETNINESVVTTTGETDVTNDGIILEVAGDILDKTRIQLRVKPRISSVREIRQFSLGTSALSAPVESLSETNSVVVVDSGQTIILGGIRSSSEQLEDSAPAGDNWGEFFRNLVTETEDKVQQKEFWILLNVNIQEGKPGDALISEAVAPA